MDNLTSLLKAVGPAAVNQDVRNKILECIQSWAAATEGRYELNYIGEVYKTLQREGFQFPPKVTVSSSMIDSSAVCGIATLDSPMGNKLTCGIASRMGRLGCLHAVSNCLHLHEPKTPLSQLWKCI